MLFGALIFATEYAMHPAELARALEERGFESLWVPEHTYIPASRRSPWPDGKELPKEYWHTYDPFVALTAAATATSRLRIATGICLVICPIFIQSIDRRSAEIIVLQGRVEARNPFFLWK